MIHVNELIQNAAQRVGIVGDGEALGPTQSQAALVDLQSLIAELNTENYLLDNYQTFDAHSVNKIKFAVKPERWYEVNKLANINLLIQNDEVEVGDIFHLTQPDNEYEFYVIRYDSVNHVYRPDTNPSWNAYMKEWWATFWVDANPDRVIGCARKVGNRWMQLYPVDKMKIDAYPKSHLATMFTSESEFVEVTYPHDDNDPNYQPYTVEYFVVEFDSIVSAPYRVTILKGIKEYKSTDPIHLSSKYISMIEDGLCVKLCQRYKYLEMKDDFANDFEGAKRMIKRINSSNRPMTYDFAGGRGYNDGYWNLMGGVGW